MEILITAVIAFVASNIDDIFLLAVFFAQTNETFRKRHIILGQYLGIAALVLVSLLGFVAGMLIPESVIGLLGLVPLFLGLHRLWQGSEKQEDEPIPEIPQAAAQGNSFLNAFLSPQSYGVALVTVANGADNLGLYIPLFAGKTLLELGIILTIFGLMVALWCYLGYSIGSYPLLKEAIQTHEGWLVPLVLIGLGIYILIENGSLTALLGLFQ